MQEVQQVSPARPVKASSDQALIYTTIALVGVGLMSVYTASAAQADMETGNSLSTLLKQVVALVIGIFGLRLTQRLPLDFFRRIARPLAIISVGLLLLTMFAGTTANGSERWIALPFGFSFQPSDVAKVAAILLMAQGLAQPSFWNRELGINLAMVSVMLLLIVKQPNLSVTMILGAVTFLMLFVSGLRRITMMVVIPPIAFLVYQEIMRNAYQMKRITGWLNPWKDPLESGYNLIQSYYAVGSGGLFGVGIGHSIQKLFYLPFQHTDFIFSVICEEWGFIGAAIVLGLFGLLGWRGFAIAWACPNPFGKLTAFGLTLALMIQAIINISVTVGLMPVTGVTLPLISYGGTSLIVTLMMIGILLNISRLRRTAPPEAY
jgi:cell division protein FtsW